MFKSFGREFCFYMIVSALVLILGILIESTFSFTMEAYGNLTCQPVERTAFTMDGDGLWTVHGCTNQMTGVTTWESEK